MQNIQFCKIRRTAQNHARGKSILEVSFFFPSFLLTRKFYINSKWINCAALLYTCVFTYPYLSLIISSLQVFLHHSDTSKGFLEKVIFRELMKWNRSVFFVFFFQQTHLHQHSFFVVQPCMVNSCSETSLRENDVKHLAGAAGARPAEEFGYETG